MAHTEIDGFKFFSYEGHQFLTVESERLSDCVAYCNSHRISALHISKHHGFQCESVDFLKECPHVTALHVQDRFRDESGYYFLKRLQFLTMVLPNVLDFSRFPKLQYLSTDWTPDNAGGILASRELKMLWLRKFKSRKSNLREFSDHAALEHLCIIQSHIESLDGVELLIHVRKLEFYYCPRLSNISAIEALSRRLESLRFDHCKRVSNSTALRDLNHLKELAICSGGEMASIGFISKLPHLEFLSVVGTNILDGDMTPCFRLKFAGFDNKRHYSHRMEQVMQVINPGWRANKSQAGPTLSAAVMRV